MLDPTDDDGVQVTIKLAGESAAAYRASKKQRPDLTPHAINRAFYLAGVRALEGDPKRLDPYLGRRITR